MAGPGGHAFLPMADLTEIPFSVRETLIREISRNSTSGYTTKSTKLNTANKLYDGYGRSRLGTREKFQAAYFGLLAGTYRLGLTGPIHRVRHSCRNSNSTASPQSILYGSSDVREAKKLLSRSKEHSASVDTQRAILPMNGLQILISGSLGSNSIKIIQAHARGTGVF